MTELTETCFERALFFSWGCKIGDCTFCYMSTSPKAKMSRRSFESLFAETIISKQCGWDIGFVSGGVGAFTTEETEFLLKIISEIYGKKVWLNIGPLSKEQLKRFSPYIKGIVGSIETINPELHKEVCPSKPIEPYETMFEHTRELGLENGMSFIVGLGEKREDFTLLKAFIEKHSITKIHVYGLNPQKGTPFEHASPPSIEDQAWWIEQLRISFPSLDIQCGIWEDRVDRVADLLEAGANSISKFPALKAFGKQTAEEIENQAKLAGRTFKGTLTKLPDIDWHKEVDKLSVDDELKAKIKEKLDSYLKRMMRNL